MAKDQEVYKLRFSVAGRTFFSVPLAVSYVDAFRVVPLSKIPALAEAEDGRGRSASLFWSSEVDVSSPDTVRSNGKMYRVLQRFPRYLTSFDGSFDDLLNGLSSRRRSTLKRKVRKFQREGEHDTIDWREYRSSEEMSEFLELARPLAEQTYQARLFDGALPSDTQFRSDALQAAGRGLSRGYLLFLQQQPVAYLYTPQVDDTLVYAYLGYDSQMSSLSPGTVLQYLVHERLFVEKSVKYFDFTAGEGDHKALFSTQQYACCDVLCVPDSFRMNLLMATHRNWNRLVLRLRQIADAAQVSSKFRRLLRRG